MSRFSILFLLFISFELSAPAQTVLTREQAVDLIGRNPAYTSPARLELERQQQLSGSSLQLDNPELEYEIDPYDPTVLGVILPLRFPSVYLNRRSLQKERVRLSELMLRLNRNEINRLVQNTYNETQFLGARLFLLRQQDSLYQLVKVAAQRNFEAGQINKLEELFAVNEANNVNNELNRTTIEYTAQKRALSYILDLRTDFMVDSLTALKPDTVFLSVHDTLPNTLQQEILQQQIAISRRELQVERSELFPQVNAGPLFGLQAAHGETKRLGLRIGVSVPLWLGQNRSRIRAARLGVEIAEAERVRALQDYRQQYQTTLGQVLGGQRSIVYYNSTGLPQSNEIIVTALRLFQAGQLDYIETIRQIITAYETRVNYLQTVRDFNQAVIELKYLNGTL